MLSDGRVFILSPLNHLGKLIQTLLIIDKKLIIFTTISQLNFLN